MAENSVIKLNIQILKKKTKGNLDCGTIDHDVIKSLAFNKKKELLLCKTYLPTPAYHVSFCSLLRVGYFLLSLKNCRKS